MKERIILGEEELPLRAASGMVLKWVVIIENKVTIELQDQPPEDKVYHQVQGMAPQMETLQIECYQVIL